MLFRSTQAQAASFIAGKNLQPGAIHDEGRVETGLVGADDVTDFDLPGGRPDFEAPLAIRAARRKYAKLGVDQFVAGIEQIQGGQFAAA